MTVREYIGARYVPLFMGNWDNTVTYEPLSIVQYQGNSYTSRQFVPIGIAIDNEAYWAETGSYNAQVEQYRQEVMTFDNRITTNANNIDTLAGYTENLIRVQTAGGPDIAHSWASIFRSEDYKLCQIAGPVAFDLHTHSNDLKMEIPGGTQALGNLYGVRLCGTAPFASVIGSTCLVVATGAVVVNSASPMNIWEEVPSDFRFGVTTITIGTDGNLYCYESNDQQSYRPYGLIWFPKVNIWIGDRS